MKNYMLICLAISVLNFTHAMAKTNEPTEQHVLSQSMFEKFKETTTIFVFSDLYENEAYEEILRKSWTVTPYEIVSYDEFYTIEYIGKGKYSFASIELGKGISSINPSYKHSRISSSFSFKMYYEELFFDEYKPEMSDNEINVLLMHYQIDMAEFELFLKTDYLLDIYNADKKKVQQEFRRAYTDDVFYNYTMGSLQNQLQDINQLISNEEYRKADDHIEKAELKELTKNKLYIPEYVKIKTAQKEDKPRSSKELEKIFDGYEYNYEFISEEALEKKYKLAKRFITSDMLE